MRRTFTILSSLLSGSLLLSSPSVAQIVEHHPPSQPERGAQFGASLTSAALTQAPWQWVFVGSPDSSHAGLPRVGRVDCLPAHESVGAPRFHVVAPPGHALPDARFGFAIEAADVDGDGFEDLIVSAPFQDVGDHEERGRAFIFYGPWTPEAHPPYTAYTVLEPNPADIDPESQRGPRFGYSVAVGDLDGSGPLDIVLGTPCADDLNANPPIREAGAIDIFLNPRRAFTLTPDRHVHQDREFRAAYNHYGWVVEIGNIGAPLGSQLGDIAVGVPDDDYVALDSGRWVVHYGHTDSNGPAWNEAPGLYQDWTGQAYAAFGRYGATIALGDFTLDGWDDMALGGPGSLKEDGWSEGSAEGRITIFASDGEYLHTHNPPASAIFAPSPFRHPANLFAFSMTFAQVDEDAFLELVVGAPEASNMPMTGRGRVLVYEARINIPPYHWAAQNIFEDPHLLGDNRFGWAVDVTRRLAAPHLDDIIIGAPFADIRQSVETGECFVWNH